MHARRAACAALLIAATATACSGSTEPKTIRVTTTKTVPASPSPTSARANTKDGPLKLNDKATVDDNESSILASVQALSYTQPVKNISAPVGFQGGDVWGAAEVKVCNSGSDAFTVSQFPWHLAYADGTNIEVTGDTGGDMPKPEFPMDRTVQPGSCARGKIAWPVPSDKRPERLVYEPEGAKPVEWTIPNA